MKCAVIVGAPRRASAFQATRGVRVLSSPEDDDAGVIANWAARTDLPPGSGDTLVLNRPEAVHLAAPGTREALWALAGLRVGGGRGSTWYRAHVFDLRVLRVLRVNERAGSRPVRVRSARGSRMLRSVARAAVRAVYALRLDFGVVDLAWRAGKPAILRLSLRPPVRGKTARRYARALRRFAHLAAHREEEFCLGADPEFVVMDRRRRLVVASRYLSRSGEVGVDNQRLRGSRSWRPIIELRPRPSADPNRLVYDMRRLLVRMPRGLRRRGLLWCAGSGPVGAYPIGGHVHLSGIPVTGPLLRALDTYLALPLLFVEHPRRARRRRRRYGLLGEYRLKRWGFEYRTPPSWLVAPRFAHAALILTRLVGGHWRRLPRDPFLAPPLTRAFYDCDKDTLYPQFERVWSDLQALPDYERYAEALEALARLVRDRLRWKEERDFRREWGVS